MDLWEKITQDLVFVLDFWLFLSKKRAYNYKTVTIPILNEIAKTQYYKGVEFFVFNCLGRY
jgi:hypothetical protein